MGERCQVGVATLLTCLVLQATVGVAYQGPQSYYWSRTRGDSSHFSQRSHIGPLPHVNNVMAEWSRWSSWDRCSRSCGGGVRSRSRTCVTRFPRVMPGSGVRTSHDRCAAGGESVEYGVCGVAPCPPAQVSGLSFRAAQCRHYNNKRVFGRLVNNWVPYTQGGINPCALVCEGEGEGIVYTFGKVTDGTHCKTDRSQDGLCVNGRCLRVSCDGRLGGTAREDMCRVCGGKNDTCTHHLGVFHTDLPAADQPPPPVPNAQATRPRSFGYYEVTNIPRGSTNIKVRDTSSNFLALKAGTKYMLNGDWLIDWPGEVEAGGTSFTYSRAENDSESLFTLGPTTEDLTLMVLLREHNPGIHYEYWTPNSQGAPRPEIVPLPPTDTTTTTTTTPSSTTTPTTTSTTTTTTTSSTTTTSTSTTTPSATAPRPAVLTSVNVTRFHRPPHSRSRLPQRSENEIHKPRKPSKTKGQGDGKGQRGRKRKKGQRGKKGKGREGKKQRGKKGKKGRGGKRRPEVPASCGACEKPRRQTKHMFCTSDFVSRVEVVGSEAVAGERRLEVVVHQSYKNTVPLLHKEFLWVTNPCECPRLRHGRSYLVMGVTEPTGGREVRLVLNRGSYVRRYKPRNLARILRIRHNEMRFCTPWRRDLTSLNNTIAATT